jgi:hypothetical protein
MRSRRWIALVCGASLLVALAPCLAQAQSTAASSSSLLPTTTSSSSTSSGGGSTSTSSSTVSAAIGQGLVTSATTIAATSGTPSATSIPSNSNYLGSSYVNYFTLGLPQNYQSKFGAQNVTPNITGTFGKYIYVANPSNTAGTASTTATQGIGFTTFGQPRAPAYSTAFAETFPIVRPELTQVQAEASDAIARSSMLKNKSTIQVAMNGPVVLLTGAVGSETERATAEGMVRMTPGVTEVQNNLVVDPSKK